MIRNCETVTLTDPSGVCEFRKGASADIATMSEADARAIFGDPLYERWLATKDDPKPRGTVTITGIDHAASALTCDQRGGR